MISWLGFFIGKNRASTIAEKASQPAAALKGRILLLSGLAAW